MPWSLLFICPQHQSKDECIFFHTRTIYSLSNTCHIVFWPVGIKLEKKKKQCFFPYNCNRNRRNKPNTYVHTHSHAHAHTLTQYLGGTDPKVHGLSLQQPATILLKTVFVEGAIQQKHKTMPGRQNTRVVFEISLIKSYFYFMYSKNL